MEDAIIIKPGEAGDVPRLTEIYNRYIAITPIRFDKEPVSAQNYTQLFSNSSRTPRLIELMVASPSPTKPPWLYTGNSAFKR